MAGAAIRLWTAGGVPIGETRSGADGRFALPAPAGSGPFDMTADYRGFARARRRMDLPPAGELRLHLELAAGHSGITVTASRGTAGEAASADSVAVVRDRADFDSRPLPTIAHALQGSPDIFLQQTSAAQVSPFLRGLTGYHVLALVDGIRFNNATFRSGPNQYLAWLEPGQAERIEATLGPSSSQYGSDSLGGTIQVLTREARFGASGRPEWHGTAGLHGATADVSSGADVELGAATGRFAWLVSGAGRRHNDLRAGGGRDSRHALRKLFGLDGRTIARLVDTRQQDTAFSQWGAGTKLAARLTHRQVAAFWYQTSRQEGSRNYKDLWGGLGRLQSALAPQALHFAYARYEKLGLGPLDTVSATFSANVQRDGSRRQNLRATDPVVIDESQVNVFGYSGQTSTHFGSRHALLAGGELYDEHIASSRATGPAPSRPLYPDGSRYRTGAMFAQHRMEIGNRLRATLGGRWTRVDYTTREDAFGTAASSQDFQDWTFSTNLAWQPTESLGIHALFGRGFRAPNANDLGAVGLNDLGYEIPAADSVPAGAILSSGAGEGAVSLGRPVERLKPERLLSYELGLRWQRRRHYLRIQLFDAELYDPITRRTLLFSANAVPQMLAGLPVTAIAPTAAQWAQGVVTVATPLDPRAVKAFVNDGRSRYNGVETIASLRLHLDWTLEGVYSWLNGRDLNPNRNIRRLPPQQGALTLRYATSRFWWQTSLQAAGPQNRLSSGDLDDERIGDSRSRNDIAAFFNGSRIAPFLGGGAFLPTGETLLQIQNRVLPAVADSTRVPLYTTTAGWLVWNLQAGIPLNDRLTLRAGAFNLLDRNYRVHGSGIDAPGFNAFLGLRWSF